ncbi:S-type pyocin domain-containing protein [Vibrio campbellii]|uniref:S-type pyocin domain-containing protein n=1 Tax=Vibrio campbellii TaxID=680 RepID=UPI00210A1220|nr:S-type pyocin domain-containing protein [Vibrio campbellii]UTZ25257.1 hypothetical protein HB760_25805 [Vibrio campbellii]
MNATFLEDNVPTIYWTPEENGEASWQTTPDHSDGFEKDDILVTPIHSDCDASITVTPAPENGKGVTQDNAQAYMWLSLARHNGFKIPKKLYTLNKLMTPSDIIEAQEAFKVCLESNYKKCAND